MSEEQASLTTAADLLGNFLEGLARGFETIGDHTLTGAEVADALRDARVELRSELERALVRSVEGEHDGDEHGDHDEATDDEHDG
jgi:hypothetical protein